MKTVLIHKAWAIPGIQTLNLSSQATDVSAVSDTQ